MKILFVSDSLAHNSGLTCVCKNIMEGFKSINPKIQIGHVSITGETPTQENIALAHGKGFVSSLGSDTKLYVAKVTSPNYQSEFDQVINDFKPELVIVNQDPWHCEAVVNSKYRSSYLWVFYATVESSDYPEFIMLNEKNGSVKKVSIKNIFEDADLVIPATNMGKKVINSWNVETTDPVYHGINLSEKVVGTISKNDVLGIDQNDSFVFMTVGNNSERKALYRTVVAFSNMLKLAKADGKDLSKYHLYVHTDVITPGIGGTDLIGLSIELGISEHVSFNTDIRIFKGEDRYSLSQKYAAADAYIGLPYGEGFGLGFLEAMLQGKPVVYIDAGGHAEYCRQVSPLAVRVSDYIYAKNAAIKWALADTTHAAQHMYALAEDKDLYKRLSDKATQYVVKETWTNKTADMYKKIMSFYNNISEKRKSLIGTGVRKII